MENSRILSPYKCMWMKFTDYYRYCDNIAFHGATYGFVFNETIPKDFQFPCEFEGCVYIGKSAGYYYDKQNGRKGKVRSHVHKRMTSHHKPLTTGIGGETSHSKIIEVYGYGDHVLDGTFTNLPMWLGLILPQPDFQKEDEQLMNRWTLHIEQMQLLQYRINFGKETLGNGDADTRKDMDSYSTHRMNSIKQQDLTQFFGEAA